MKRIMNVDRGMKYGLIVVCIGYRKEVMPSRCAGTMGLILQAMDLMGRAQVDRDGTDIDRKTGQRGRLESGLRRRVRGERGKQRRLRSSDR